MKHCPAARNVEPRTDAQVDAVVALQIIWSQRRDALTAVVEPCAKRHLHLVETAIFSDSVFVVQTVELSIDSYMRILVPNKLRTGVGTEMMLRQSLLERRLHRVGISEIIIPNAGMVSKRTLVVGTAEPLQAQPHLIVALFALHVVLRSRQHHSVVVELAQMIHQGGTQFACLETACEIGSDTVFNEELLPRLAVAHRERVERGVIAYRAVCRIVLQPEIHSHSLLVDHAVSEASNHVHIVAHAKLRISTLC